MSKKRATKTTRKPLKVDFIRYYAQDLQERLDRGESVMEGRSTADVERYIKLLKRIVEAVDSGDADEAYYASWNACAWHLNSSLAIPVAKGRTHVAAHKRKGAARKQRTAEDHAKLVAAVASMRKARPDASLSKIRQEVAKNMTCSERTVYNAWRARTEK